MITNRIINGLQQLRKLYAASTNISFYYSESYLPKCSFFPLKSSQQVSSSANSLWFSSYLSLMAYSLLKPYSHLIWDVHLARWSGVLLTECYEHLGIFCERILLYVNIPIFGKRK